MWGLRFPCLWMPKFLTIERESGYLIVPGMMERRGSAESLGGLKIRSSILLILSLIWYWECDERPQWGEGALWGINFPGPFIASPVGLLEASTWWEWKQCDGFLDTLGNMPLKIRIYLLWSSRWKERPVRLFVQMLCYARNTTRNSCKLCTVLLLFLSFNVSELKRNIKN